MPALGEILKGSMNSANATLSGTLTPEQAHNFIDVIKQNNGFLQKIHTEKMGRLQKELDAWDVAKGILVRVPSGDKPNESQRAALSKVGTKLDAKSVQLFSRILQDALEDNKHNPKFEEETFYSFAKAFGNDLALLGFEGVSDSYDGNFNTLHKGWVQVVKDASEATKITYQTSEKVTNRLTALAQSINPDVLSEAVILINPADAQEYNKEISTLNSPTHLIAGGAKSVLGIPFEVTPLMPKGTYLATPLKNLVLGIVIDIRRNRWYDAEERALKYVFDVFVDYEVVIKKWASLMSKA
ncbi:P2 family phage major capsid protein [Campylobacter hyointestinalis]|uniref:P2 family phage major capsid protein n=1 Tax=Campylobacter hyointestinalis TaxID=198 RepID=UPI00072BFD4D|nr:P2 family phage major capsid protein [Campylobacter hyointestinalis]CUU82272.1 Phage capsid family [Campylobacter hyointestinalis subsp. hyointestinalis]